MGIMPCFAVIALFAASPAEPSIKPISAGEAISCITRLDISSGRIFGKKTDYYFDIPTMWSGYMVADREQSARNPLERLKFYYVPSNKALRPVPIVTISVSSRGRFSREIGYRKLFETEDYVFSAWVAEYSKLNSATDSAVFNLLVGNAREDQYRSSVIRFIKPTKRLYDDTIWVNGAQLNAKTVQDGNLTFLPVRDVCAALGYKVGWFPVQNTVALSKDDFYSVLVLNNINVNGGFRVRLIDNRAYISSLYFTSKLKLNVDVDERGNVMIYE